MALSLECEYLCDLPSMQEIAKKLQAKLVPGSVVTITGNLGAGKTTFTNSLCKAIGITEVISSPTYTYMNIYEDKVCHFDLYRIKTKEQFFSLGLEEYIDSSFITIIEWPEIIEDILPENTISITIKHKEHKREVKIHGVNF